MIHILCLIQATMLAAAGAMPSATIRVPGDEPTIQAGIDAAENGDVVLVADGTYRGAGNREIDFRGKAIEVRSENGPDRCVIDCEGQGRAFFFSRGEGPDSVLDGFTIIGGDVPDDGGGIICFQSSPTIKNCRIVDNVTTGGGGGLFLFDSDATIVDCRISDNSADRFGGAIHTRSGGLALGRCTVIDNKAARHGGGLYTYSTDVTLVDTVVIGNETPHDGGGMHCGGKATLINCIYGGNKASQGGGIHTGSSLELTNCTFYANEASYRAGGLWASDRDPPVITNCIFWQNVRGQIQVW